MNALHEARRPWILGHRGAPRVALENTLEAFRAALSQGADGVELDVRRARCGQLVVGHDASLERFTQRATRVRSSSAWALSRERLTAYEGLPTLRQVLQLLRGKVINVELKADDGDVEALVAALGRELPWLAQCTCVYSSFEPDVLWALRRRWPSLSRGLLVPTEPQLLGQALCRGWLARPAAIHPFHAWCSQEQVTLWHAAGLRVHTWTVDDEDDLERVFKAGVDAVISNQPGRALAVAKRLGLR